MDQVRQYLLGLICAALVCSIAGVFLGKKGTLGAAAKLVSGVFMILAVVTPWLHVTIRNPADFLSSVSTDAENLIAEGQTDANQALEKIIKSKTEAYILDKAKLFGAELTVEVRVDGSALPAPCGVTVSGSISPFGKQQLSAILRDDLGIALEDQIWNG